MDWTPYQAHPCYDMLVQLVLLYCWSIVAEVRKQGDSRGVSD